MAERQTTLNFPIRKKCPRQSKRLLEKENVATTRRSTRHTELTISNTTEKHDRTDFKHEDPNCTVTPATPSKTLSPSKRKSSSSKGCSSPPKLSCPPIDNNELTPSTRLTNLTLSTPESKPVPFTRPSPENFRPSELFPKETETVDDIIRKIRLALHTSAPKSMPGREHELSVLKDFLVDHIKKGTSGSMYISGPPGTGKTACLNYLTKYEKEISGHFTTVKINCTTLNTPEKLYSQIVSQLKLEIRGCQTDKGAIEKYLSKKENMKLFVLDELDQLQSRGQSILYTVFEWPVLHPRGLVLVGIANALDLTDRTLPRLRARPDLTPRLLHFAPYSRQQIINIINRRLDEYGIGDVFPAKALQMLASKEAAVSGDIRRALDLGKKVIAKAGNSDQNNPQPVAVKVVPKPSENQIPALSSGTSPRKTDVFRNGMSSPVKTSASPYLLRSPLKTVSPNKSVASPRRQLDLSPTKTSSPRRQLYLSPTKTSSPRRQLYLSPTKTSSTSQVASPRTSPRKLFQSPTKKRLLPTVDLKSVMSVVGEVYGNAQLSGAGAEELPLQQKIAVCTLLLILRNGKNKDVTVGKLHEVYRRVCKKKRFEPLDQASFLSMLSLIEARGILLIQGKGKPSRLSKVCLQWVEDEVVTALKDRDLYATILSDVTCLS